MTTKLPQFYEITEIRDETPTIKTFVFLAPAIAQKARAGQFLMVLLPNIDEIPISVACADSSSGIIELAIAKVGDCTSKIHELREGDTLGLRGPYGNGFDVSYELESAWLVAGGCGAAPLRFLAEELKEKGVHVTSFLGARSREHLLYVEHFRKVGEVRIATDDGSAGFKGFVTDLLKEELRKEKPDMIFTCGPEIMMRKVCEIAAAQNIPVQASIERIVKCARGACGACDIFGFRVCKDGPVFDGKFLLKTEFGRWKRDKSGKRIAIAGNDISSPPIPPLKIETNPKLSMELFGIKFGNPFMNAAGFGVSGMLLYRYARNGAGAVVTKSVGKDERTGFPNPTFAELDDGTYVNAMGLPNPGIDNYKLDIIDAKKANVPLIVSIFGQNEEECIYVASKAIEYGADMIEINVSCPHTEISSVENDPELVKSITKAVVEVAKKNSIPVSVKISPNCDYIAVAKAAEEGGASAITAINTKRAKPTIRMDGEEIKLLGNPTGYGGMSGRKHKEVGKKVVYELYEELNIPIIGVGGIFDGGDAFEYAACGASLFQIGSAMVNRGISVFAAIQKELEEELEKRGFERLGEAVGAYHKR